MSADKPSSSLKQLKALIRKWLLEVIQNFDDRNDDITKVTKIEGEIYNEVTKLLKDRDVDTTELEKRFEDLMKVAPKELPLDSEGKLDPEALLGSYDEEQLREKIASLKEELDVILAKPEIADLSSEIMAEIVKVMSTEDVMDLCTQFMQEGIAISSDPSMLDQDDAMDRLNSLIREICDKLANALVDDE